MRTMLRGLLVGFAGALLTLAGSRPAHGQEVRIRDLTTAAQDVPVRVMGYGLVVGLDGTGDRAIGNYGSVHTVRSVTNLLRRFGIEVPPEVLRTRNVAAVLVTAEISPYLRPGGRFDVNVASMGDAVSLRGGVLWATPLVTGPSQAPFATAQGPIVLSDGTATRRQYNVETSGLIPEGGLLETESAHPDFAATSELVLRDPDLGTASRIADAIVAKFGQGSAAVKDPGAVSLKPPQGQPLATFLTQVEDLTLTPDRAARVVVDGRDGTVVAGGNVHVGEAVVSHGTMTLAIGASVTKSQVPNGVLVPPGTTVQDIAVALHSVAATPSDIAAIFRSLKEVGALRAEVVVR